MAHSLEAGPLTLRSGERAVFFLPVTSAAHFFWGTVLPQEALDHLFLLPPGCYTLELATPGVASLHLEVLQVAPGGNQEVLAPLGVPVEP